MKNRVFLASIIGSLVFGSASLFAQDAQRGHGAPEPPAAGIHWAKGEGKQAGPLQAGPVKLLNSNGGPVQHGTAVTPIFWGASWGNSTFVGDKMDGLQTFYQGVGGSNYANTNTEYYDASGNVSSGVTSNLSILDLSTAAASGNSTSAILAEVCKVTNNKPAPGGYYPVYVDSLRGSAGYCAWHSAGSCNGTQIQFAFFFNLDGDSGCDPRDISGNHSQGLAALANVSGHELSEMLTDPKLNAWFDRQGNENADKCAWTFGSGLLTFGNGSKWKIQGNWSNNAYNNNTGYHSGSTFERGCIDGSNN